MSVAFAEFVKETEKRVAAGKITQQTRDIYWRSIYAVDSPRAKADSIKLEAEMGHLTIGEAGRPSFLADYLDDVAEVVPGVACRHYTVLMGTFKMLTLAGLFDVSPMAPVPKPERQGGGGQRALCPEERDLLYELICAKNRRAKYFRMFYLTMLGTGIRPGEAFALRWDDILGLDDTTVENAVVRIGATAVKPMSGGPVFRQNKRKNGREGGYHITLSRWLTTELREYKCACAPESGATPVFLSRLGRMVEPMGADQNLACAKADSPLEWVTWGNLRDTVATHIAGRTGDKRRASAQLGHSEGASVTVKHYIDQGGYVRIVVDNAEVLEELKPAKVGAKLDSGAPAKHSD
ncbi:tyrosine-type recombinase/integrase [Nocardia sp. NPDC050406]|uniref:tyrosine-type recombinase/integrase n=1 Tax=Nocardia sp. NPDC050406 TaxID=3364318 RepID=UPI0037A42396